MVIGGVPLTILQSIMTSYPVWIYTGVPILTVLLPLVITDGLGTYDPSSISGGSSIYALSIFVPLNFIECIYIYCTIKLYIKLYCVA